MISSLFHYLLLNWLFLAITNISPYLTHPSSMWQIEKDKSLRCLHYILPHWHSSQLRMGQIQQQKNLSQVWLRYLPKSQTKTLLITALVESVLLAIMFVDVKQTHLLCSTLISSSIAFLLDKSKLQCFFVDLLVTHTHTHTLIHTHTHRRQICS